MSEKEWIEKIQKRANEHNAERNKAEQAEKKYYDLCETQFITASRAGKEINDLTAQLEEAKKEIERLGSLRAMREVTDQNARLNERVKILEGRMQYISDYAKFSQLSNQGDGK